MNVYKSKLLKEKNDIKNFWKRFLTAIVQKGSGHCIRSKPFLKFNFSQNEHAFEI